MSKVTENIRLFKLSKELTLEDYYSGSPYNCSSSHLNIDYFCKKGCWKYMCSSCGRGTNNLFSKGRCPTLSCVEKKEREIQDLIKTKNFKFFELYYPLEYSEYIEKTWRVPFSKILTLEEIDKKLDDKKYIPFKNATCVKKRSIYDNTDIEIIPIEYIIYKKSIFSSSKIKLNVGYPVYRYDELIFFFKNIKNNWIRTSVDSLRYNESLNDYEIQKNLKDFYEVHKDKIVNSIH